MYKNNLLNIRYVKGNTFVGVSCDSQKFCDFDSIAYCVRAALVIISQYRRRGKKTIEEIITTWAPPSENKTSKYISFVCDRLNYHKGTEISVYKPVQLYMLLQAMCKMETGAFLYHADFDEGYRMFAESRPDLFAIGKLS